MKIITACCQLTALIVLCGCSSMKTNIGYDAKFNFAGLKSFGWIPYPADQRADVRLNYDFLNRHIHAAVDDELRRKGLLQVADNQPDMRIRWYVAVNEAATDSQVSTYGGFAGSSGWGYDQNARWIYTTPLSQGYQHTYTVGSLVLDFLDAKTGHLIWRGGASTVVDANSAPEQRRQKINQAVQKLLQQFPPAASQPKPPKT